MARVTRGNNRKNKRKKVLKAAKGYFGSKHRLYRTANEQVMRSMKYAYRDRRQKKRDFRKLWITRINAAARLHDISYSRFMNGLKLANIEVDRKMLAELAVNDEKAFASLVDASKKALAKGPVKAEPKKEVKPATKPAPSAKPVEKKEEPKPVAKKEAKAEQTDLSKLTVAELKAQAKEAGIKGYTSMKKAELVAALN